jgi:DNA-binding transcriptional LysR family regulator
MDKLTVEDLKLFSRLSALGTLSAVARERDVPVSQISRSLTRIERACGARLVHRSTHAMTLTAEGQHFLEHGEQILRSFEELEGEFAEKSQEPAGRVRVASSTVVAQYLLLPSLPGLAKKHPKLRIDLEVSDRLVDMAREGIDIAIRTGSDLPEALVARRIGSLGRALYAAPGYAARRGLPQHPSELAQHDLVTNSAVGHLNHWAFVVDGKPVAHAAHAADGRWRANDTGVVTSMVVRGLGIGRMATIVGEPLVREGRLVRVLAGQVDRNESPIHAVMASTRQRLPKLRACVDHWAQWFSSVAGGAA